MPSIEEVDGGYKVAWRRKLPSSGGIRGGYTTRSRWTKDLVLARKLSEAVAANHGLLPGALVLERAGLFTFAEAVDPVFVIQVAGVLADEHLDDAGKVDSLRGFLAAYEDAYDNTDGRFGREA